ncbi:MAG: biotin/lipoyl-containing protein [Candidatus Egerieousia sp.]
MAEEINKGMEEKLYTFNAEIHDAVLDDDSSSKSGGLQLAEGGRVYQTRLTKKFLERKQWKAPNPLQVLSNIPGSVVEVFVKPGEKVTKGDKLMVYEAMKMKNIINAPMDGEIRSVAAKVGEHLPKGALLVTFKKPRAAVKK